MRDNPHMPATQQPAPGTELAGYRIEELVGRGGMGEVYRAHDPRLDRNVALKVLAPRFAADEEFRERLLLESRIAASLDHPNVIPVYDAGEAEGRLYLAMRYVEGTDLKALLRREGALDAPRAVTIATQMADALDAAHERGLVHRDVKPANVLVDKRGHAYLADFGLTQSVSDRPTDGSLMGTIDYLAPEQIRGETVDGRTDQYALGCLLFECLTGTLPYNRGSDVAALYAHLEEPVPMASSRRAELPAEIDAVLARAMAKEPADRYASCRELVEHARAALGLGSPARRGPRLAIAGGTVAIVVTVALVSALLLTRGSTPAPVTGSLIRIDATTNAVTARYAVSAHPGVITTARGRVWVGDFRDGSLWRLDPASGDLQRFTTTGEPRDITALADDVYVASDGETVYAGSVTRYDAVTGQREAGVPLLACTLAAGEGVLWVAGCPFIQRLSTDLGRFRILATVPVPWLEPRSAETNRFAMRDMAIGEGALWVLGDPVDRRVFRVDPTTGEIRSWTHLRFAPRSIAAGEGAVWVTGLADDVVAQLDPESGRVTRTTTVANGASGIAVGAGSVWVTSALARVVSRLDPVTGSVSALIDVEQAPREISVGAGAVWVTTDAG